MWQANKKIASLQAARGVAQSDALIPPCKPAGSDDDQAEQCRVNVLEKRWLRLQMPARGVRLVPWPAVHLEIDNLALLERRFRPQRCIWPVSPGTIQATRCSAKNGGAHLARSLGHATSRALPPRIAAGNRLHLSLMACPLPIRYVSKLD